MKKVFALILSFSVILTLLCSCSYDSQKEKERAAIELSYKGGSLFTLGVSDDLQVVYIDGEDSEAKRVLTDYYDFSAAPLADVIEELTLANFAAEVEGCKTIEIEVTGGFADKDAITSELQSVYKKLSTEVTEVYIQFDGQTIESGYSQNEYYYLCESCGGSGIITCPACGGVGTGCTKCSGSGSVWVSCEKCDGSGKLSDGTDCTECGCDGGADTVCTECDGNGVVNYCATCNGTGTIACSACDGTGDVFLQ